MNKGMGSLKDDQQSTLSMSLGICSKLKKNLRKSPHVLLSQKMRRNFGPSPQKERRLCIWSTIHNINAVQILLQVFKLPLDQGSKVLKLPLTH